MEKFDRKLIYVSSILVLCIMLSSNVLQANAFSVILNANSITWYHVYTNFDPNSCASAVGFDGGTGTFSGTSTGSFTTSGATQYDCTGFDTRYIINSIPTSATITGLGILYNITSSSGTNRCNYNISNPQSDPIVHGMTRGELNSVANSGQQDTNCNVLGEHKFSPLSTTVLQSSLGLQNWFAIGIGDMKHTGSNSFSMKSIQIQVNYTAPNITLSPSSGHIGDTITISGNTFSPTEHMNFTFNGVLMTTTPATVITNGSGFFSGVTITVPIISDGVKVINATGMTSNLRASANFNVGNNLSINPVSGKVGTFANVQGSFFTPSDVASLYFNGTLVKTTPIDTFGNLNDLIKIPSATFGSHIVQANDTHSKSNSTSFSVLSGEILSPGSGPSSSTLTISGNGYAGTHTVTIFFNGVLMVTSPGVITTNSTGSFTGVTITVPILAPGSYSVQAIDSLSHTDTQTFSIVTREPLPPTLTSVSDSPTSIRFTSIANVSPSFYPIKDYSLQCSVNGGAYVLIVTNSTLPPGRFNEYSGLGPSDSVSCQWRDGSLGGWSNWSNVATSSTGLSVVQPPRGPPSPGNLNGLFNQKGNDPLAKVIQWIDKQGGLYFGFSVIPLAVMLIGMMATPKTTGIFAIATLMAMGIVQGAGFFVYPIWYWGMSMLLGIVVVLSRANEK